jgi:hypothetical protein
MTTPLRPARGATRFEFAIAAMAMAILAGVLLHYLLRYRAEAEVAGVRYQVASMRTALAGKAMEASLSGDCAAFAALAGANPVRFLDRAPPGYHGEVESSDMAEIPPGSWFFDRKQQILVYLFSGNKTFSGQRFTRWSFHVESLCLPTNNAKPPGTPDRSANPSVALHQVDG